MRNPSAPTNSNSTKNVRTPCCTKVGLKRGPWTPEEDELLASYITKEGEGRWRTLPKRAGLLRCGKSCRLRWMNYLRPCVKRGHIAADEEDLILRLHRLLGNRWSLIAGRIPGRTDNEIKNYWNTHLSKKLISQGIDPRTHKPLNQTDHHPHHHQSSPAANPNPNPSDLILEGEGGHGHVQGDCTQEGLHSKVESDDLQNGDGAGTRMVIGLKGGSSHGNSEQEDDIDYCSDDIFSSFLNSLINDDMFVQQQQQQQQQQQGSVEPVTPGFGYGTFWEPLISTAPGVNGDEHGRESKR